MVNYQCVAIGINRYHFLQPLSAADADAQILHRFFTQEAKIAEQQSLLLTDTSPLVNHRSTYPHRDNLLSWLEVKLKAVVGGGRSVQESEVQKINQKAFWFYFSGYAINYQGEDYLMPIDGNPKDILGTGIALRSLFESFQRQGTRQIFVVLDLQGLEKGKMSVGKQAIALAKQMKISLILSCQPDKFSVRGLLTAALLEAFHHYGQKITLAKLEQYLRDRLPEFNFPSWQQSQVPVVISSSLEASHHPLLTFSSLERLENGFAKVAIALPKLPDPPMAGEVRQGVIATRNSGTPDFSLPAISPSENVNQSSSNRRKKLNFSSFMGKIAQYKWFFWGLSCSFLPLLLVTIFVSYWLQVRQSTTISDRPSEVSETKVISQIEQDILNRARIKLKNNQASDFNRAIGSARQSSLENVLNRQAESDIERWSQIILDIAEGRARTGDFSSAIAAAELVPRDRATLYQTARQKIQLWKTLLEQQQVNQSLIETAKELIDPSQAFTYNQAIAILSQITPEQPTYQESRQFINNWSQKIYFLAISRATEGKFDRAIETAKLIPTHTPLYEDAQKAIARWQQKISQENEN